MENTDQLEQPDQLEPDLTTVELTATEDTIRAIEMLFSPNLEDLQKNSPELYSYYTLFGAAEGLLRSAKLLAHAAPDHPELAIAIGNIAKTISKTGQEMFQELEEAIKQNPKLLDSSAALIEAQKLDSLKVQNIMKSIAAIDVDLPDHLK